MVTGRDGRRLQPHERRRTDGSSRVRPQGRRQRRRRTRNQLGQLVPAHISFPLLLTATAVHVIFTYKFLNDKNFS